jgi:hypothetical protein
MQRFENQIYTHELLHAVKRRISKLLKEECLAGKVISHAGGAWRAPLGDALSLALDHVSLGITQSYSSQKPILGTSSK